MSDEKPVSWMAIRQNAPVTNREGKEIGVVEAVLGDDEDGIFHGLGVNLKGWGGHVEVPAVRVERITTAKVYTDLSDDDLESLEELKPDRWFEFEGRSRFLKRVKWGKDD